MYLHYSVTNSLWDLLITRAVTSTLKCIPLRIRMYLTNVSIVPKVDRANIFTLSFVLTILACMVFGISHKFNHTANKVFYQNLSI